MPGELGPKPETSNAYRLVQNPEFSGFQKLLVTQTDPSQPGNPATEIEVTFADGTIITIDPNTPFFTFIDSTGIEITLIASTLAHINQLHVKGEQSGSTFTYSSVENFCADIIQKLPPNIGSEVGLSEFSIDTQKPVGKEGIATLAELKSEGVISDEDLTLAESARAEVQKLNRSGEQSEKKAFIEGFKQQNPHCRVQFQLVRGSVLVPMVNTTKRNTTSLFMVIGPGPGADPKKTVYTMAPGRHMPRHPNPDEHKNKQGVLNEKKFQESLDAWFDTAMLVGKERFVSMKPGSIVPFRSAADIEHIPADAHIIGIEVPPTTAQKILDRCKDIIDPQHTLDLGRCAAMETLLRLQRTFFITPRLDLDAATSMALMLAEGLDIHSEELRKKIKLIDDADNFSTGTLKWPGKQPLPTPENPWINIGSTDVSKDLAGVNWLTGWTWKPPFLKPETVVRAIAYWLKYGEPENNPVSLNFEEFASQCEARDDMEGLLRVARHAATQARTEIAKSISSGEMKFSVEENDKVVHFDLMETQLPMNSTAGIGYCLAPVTTIRYFDQRTKTVRFTVAAFNNTYFDWDKFVTMANEKEQGGGKWGGNRQTCIVGSPQDGTKPTSLSWEEFKDLVHQSLK